MDKNQALLLASIVFGLVTLLHLLRSIFSWPVSIAGFNVPVWFSYVAAIVMGYLSWLMYGASRK